MVKFTFVTSSTFSCLIADVIWVRFSAGALLSPRLRLCLRHRDTRCNVGSGQCDSRALVLPNETGTIGTKVISEY
jgi:hypothetical protein